MFDRSDQPPSMLDRLDPRGRIVAAVAFCVLDTLLSRPAPLVAALALAAVAAVLAGIGPREALRRLTPLNVFMLLVVLVVPVGAEGTPLVAFGRLEYSREGLQLAAAIAMKGNAIVLAIMGLVGTMDVVVLGHALHHLGVPEKLIHVMLFSVRYFDVLRREHHRLAAAMKVRGFRPRMDRHTYRTYGYLVGMLLVRSLERSERIVAAMKCRGFRGHFYLLEHFALARRDAYFALAATVCAILLAWAEFA